MTGAVLRLAVALAVILVSAPAAHATPGDGVLSILTMGDSYSAGNGAGGYSGAKGCYRSVYQQQGDHWVRYSPEAPAYARNLVTSDGGVFWVEGTAENCGLVPL